MTQTDLLRQIQQKSSFLCVGLDPDLTKIPRHLHREDDPIFAFNRQIIDATADYCVAYKPNIAFYESLGPAGWESLQKTVEYIPNEFFTIADAKRGDIGNTSAMYAKAFFETYDFDSITVAPYMGEDSVTPFLQHAGKWVILLALTSNKGSHDFQHLSLSDTQTPLYQQVLSTSQQWGSAEQLMYVVGATQAEKLKEIRQIIPDHFLLVPGVGAQGGSLEEVARYGMTDRCGLLVNSSRGIIYAGSDEDFAQQAGQAAQHLQQQMAQLLDAFKG
ncbi:MAG: orotidine-5'-phosphate decarboxylase [Cyclobacteriaceae bacterium]